MHWDSSSRVYSNDLSIYCYKKKIEYKNCIKLVIPLLIRTIVILKFLIFNVIFRVITQILVAILLYCIFNYKYILYEFLGKTKLNNNIVNKESL